MSIRSTLGVGIIRVVLKKALPYASLLPSESAKGSLECNLINPLITMSYMDNLFPFRSSPISYPLIQNIKIQQ